MGQYYQPLIEQKGKIKKFSLRDGVKLMEHSWWGNIDVSSVASILYKKQGRLAWVGDYADDHHWDDPDKPDPKYLHKLAWGSRVAESLPDTSLKLEGKYLVNHSRREYLDLDKYHRKAMQKDGWCVNPLSLLTACGNGQGGGDYWEEYPDAYLGGCWCWDILSIEDEPPKDFEEFECCFKETE